MLLVHILYVGNENQKQYVLLLTCMFTRAINLIVCESLSTADFFCALQLHIFDYGVMESVVSDNQPSFVSGLECLSKIFGETEAQDFFKTCGIKSCLSLLSPTHLVHPFWGEQ